MEAFPKLLFRLLSPPLPSPQKVEFELDFKDLFLLLRFFPGGITLTTLPLLLFELALALLFPTTFPLNWLRLLLLLLRLLLTLTTRVNMAQITAHTYSKFTSFCFTGGQNAFNYVSLVLAILTLVVNVNNNLNNNNNNLNQVLNHSCVTIKCSSQ